MIEENVKKIEKEIIKKQNEKSINKLLENKLPRWNELPDIGIYSEQLISYITDILEPYIYIENKKQKALTSSMVNNYVKTGLVPPPEKKKYYKEQIGLLIAITMLKSVYSISELNKMITLAKMQTPVNELYDKFLYIFEDSLNKIFKSNEIKMIQDIDKGITEGKYIFHNAIQTYVCKLYVQKTYIEPLAQALNSKK